MGLAGCAGSGTARNAATDQSGLDKRAHWSQASMGGSATSAGLRADFSAALGRTGKLPALITGVTADPGKPDRARVWTQGGGTSWYWGDLPLPAGRNASVWFAVSDGTTSWIGGTTWKVGERTVPFVVQSADRQTWQPVALAKSATDAAFVPNGAVPVEGSGLLLVGIDKDYKPAALVAGAQDALVSLPAAPGGREFRGFAGVAAHGRTVVAIGRAAAPGQADETVVYRSTDAGKSWSVAPGPADGPAYATGIVATDGGFVVTGDQRASGNRESAAAWSSPDGVAWKAETLPSLDPYAPADRNDIWLGAPSVSAGRLVAPMVVRTALWIAVVQRDPDGTWNKAGYTSNWILPGASGYAALNADGSVVLAQSGENSGRLGVMSADGQWTDNAMEFGAHDPGLRLNEFLNQAGDPVLTGYTPVTLIQSGKWTRTSRLSRYALDGAGAATEAAWDPAESQNLADMVAANNPSGANVVLGSKVTSSGDTSTLDKVNVAGWFRGSSQGAWAPVQGLDTARSEQISDVAFVSGTWVGAGDSRASFKSGDLRTAAVWTSTDGVTWTHADGPFQAAAGGESWASGVCGLPGGDLLAVGTVYEGAQQRPVAWRRTGGQWQRIDATAFGAAFGSLSSCVTQGGTTLIQGSSNGRDTVWRTGDGVAFQASALGGRGDTFARIRAVDGGFAAAGTRTSNGHDGAVVWLSKDARTWRAVAVPASRPLKGVDVARKGSGLVLAANSNTSPELWTLVNSSKLFTAH
jgi:hypothetical protein